MKLSFRAKENQNLIDCLKEYGIFKNKAKTFVKLGFVVVNDCCVKTLPFMVHKGDLVNICTIEEMVGSFSIVYEDSNYLIVDKEAGLLSISTASVNKDFEDTLYKRVREYLNKKHEYAFIVNRLDKETSGLVVFVKNQELKEALQANWNQLVKKRGYIAIVEGKIFKSGRVDNYLYEDKMTFSHSTKVGGKRAITNYKPLKRNSLYTMLDVEIETGRKNQIRVHMSEMVHSIVGDKKYYSKCNPLKRLGLHHYEIQFENPLDGELMEFISKVPDSFYDLFS